MVYRDGVFLKTVLAPDTSTSDNSTDGATAYSYSVRSYDFANNLSGLSAPLTVTTPPDAGHPS